ncbi:MAG: hypothetical protein HYZ54_08370 [Ignavibacteriae bacterium]|nr:hypothetical protein [Ignavibacteriota bacterium]
MGQIWNRISRLAKTYLQDSDDISSAERIIQSDADELKRIIDELSEPKRLLIFYYFFPYKLMKKSSLLLEIVVIVIVASLLGFSYNYFASPKRIPVIREEQVLVQADDSLLFAPSSSASNTTAPPVTSQTSEPIAQTAQPTTQTGQKVTEQSPIKKDTVRTDKANTAVVKTQTSISTQTPPATTSTEKMKPASVSYAQVLRLLEDKDVLFIDARNDDEWNEGHIPGAIHIFPEDFQKHIPEIIGLPRDKRIVAYCSGGPECPLSHEICDQLANFGFKRLFIYFGGWTEWKKMKAEGK